MNNRTKPCRNEMGDQGQAISEYSLAIALVALVTISGLTYLGMELASGHQQNAASIANADGLFGLLRTSGGGTGGSGSGSSFNHPNADGPMTGIGDSIPLPASGQEQLCFDTGVCLNVPATAGDPVTETAGGLGNFTRELANVIEQIADQLEAEGETPANVIQMIRDLANKGHDLGYLEQNICDASVSCQFTPTGTAEQDAVFANIDTLDNELIPAFSTQLAQLEAHAGSIPEYLMDVINLEASEIINIAEGYDLAGCYHCPHGYSMENNAALTHQNANTICSTGGSGGDCMVTSTSGSGGNVFTAEAWDFTPLDHSMGVPPPPPPEP